MDNPNGRPHYQYLPVSARGKWHMIQRKYLRFFEEYSCENADYGEMKEAVFDFIMAKTEEFLEVRDFNDMVFGRFYVYCLENYDTNLDLCMDIYLLDNMYNDGNREGEDIEWYLMYKYGPY